MARSDATMKRIAVTGADGELYAFLRDACDRPQPAKDAGPALAYVGREFRTYDFMRVGGATAFYAALNVGRWSGEGLAEDLAIAGLQDRFEIRRMKRAYRRALVLALAMATSPELLVVEGGDEFDEAPAAALLRRSIERVPRAIVTFADDSKAEDAKKATPVSGLAEEACAGVFDARFDAARFRAWVGEHPHALAADTAAVAGS